ncbi:extracellular solute-binding protein [Paenibacillus hamazuiensis]|uniref:extracellular solute-binding protein n=1 Tax=Paenibacillus hamazuiensis TaxID=2936508 RepID=UPI00200C3AD1|nr:extracellular solute-binding protein [Paenibacillus hamazuiensis]
MKKSGLRKGTAVTAVVVAATLTMIGCSEQKKATEAAASETSKKPSAVPAKRAEVTVTMYDRGAVPASEGSYEDNRWTKWINNNGPVDVKYVPILRSDSTKKLNMLFASGSAPDIINEYNTPFRDNLYNQKQLLPLDNYLKDMPEYQKVLDQYPQLKKAGTKPDGKLYYIGKMKEATPAHAFFIRTDWLKKLNLSMPETTDELLKVAKAFADQDPDGNGKKDTYGMNLSTYSQYAINEMFGAPMSDSQLSWGLKDGKIGILWENDLAALNFKKELYQGGMIDKDFLNDKDGAKAKQDFLNGKLGIYVNPSTNWYEFPVIDITTLKKNVPGAEIDLLPYPKSPLGHYTGAIDNPIQMTTAFNAMIKDPAAAAQYINFMMKPETGMKINYGDEGVHWTKDAKGCPIPTDPQKVKNEVGYAADYEIFLSRVDKCDFLVNKFDPAKPEQKAGLELYKKAQDTYMDPGKMYPGIALGQYMPTFAGDSNVIHATLLKQMTDFYVKAMISGEKYTPEQAIKDAQAAWDQAGGKKLEEDMNNWYAQNKDTAFLIKDVWEIVKQQKQVK